MAQINYNQMHWNQMNPWMAGQSQNGSNMSLNMPSSQHYPHDQSGYPPGWNNPWGGMYPYPMGMMPMMPGERICRKDKQSNKNLTINLFSIINRNGNASTTIASPFAFTCSFPGSQYQVTEIHYVNAQCQP